MHDASPFQLALFSMRVATLCVVSGRQAVTGAHHMYCGREVTCRSWCPFLSGAETLPGEIPREEHDVGRSHFSEPIQEQYLRTK